ncbi:MAG: response regulator [Chitinispirillaceae bacterium]|jgi:two-component system chemotaxis response regulator CheY|nr:response regulator [Chitinispirillaceae bacterium]
MKTLVVDDDFASRTLLQAICSPLGVCHSAENGREAIEAFVREQKLQEPYDVIFLDIMMPEMDGQTVLRKIRSMELESGILLGKGVKIIMTTALADKKNVLTALREMCDAYLVKPIEKHRVMEQFQSFGFLPRP